ncbi:MAG: hypothetical protein HYX71_04240 [Opitutae bacterium]|nr:hypothetical protein [Opitutae bacterium]
MLLPTFCFGSGVLRKPAVLIMPDLVEFRAGSVYLLRAEIGFRWDEQEPLKINVWQREKSGKREWLLGDVQIFDENGRELERQFFMSIPPMPDGEVVIYPGEYKRLGFFVWNGSVIFPRSGNYYVIATFNDAWMGKKNVIFTTSKRWFKVVEAPPKKSSL